MGKILIEMDLDTKEFSVSMDGKIVPDVDSVQLVRYQSDGKDKGSIVIATGIFDKERNIFTETRIYAKESPEAKRALVMGNAKEVVGFPGFVAIQKRIKKYV